ncbi:unnamed protein product [Ilex paraguariensis]|uniref:NAC domain-containing protein n=1 Tax=Ilex paraguariensis TaxID=185542 RepID=A0ABC8V0I4_9AQUA
MAVNNHPLEDQRLAGVNEELEWKRYIPLGYTFYPTDKEIFDYLKERVRGEHILPELIYDTDVYQCKPSDLPGLDRESEYSYYFTPRDRKYPNGKRLCRSTKDNIGYWRMTSKLNPQTESDGSPLGKKNTLVYTLNAKGVYGNGFKTDWIMHEYVLDEIRYPMNDVVLCRIYEKKSKQVGKEREQSPSESQGRLCTESSVVAHHQTNLIERKQSPIHHIVLEVGEPSCGGQWNTPQPYEPSKKSRHLVGEPCQLPTKSSPFQAQLCQISRLDHLISERSALWVGKSSVASQLNQIQPSQEEAAFRPLSARQPIWGQNSETISGLVVGNSIAQSSLISSMNNLVFSNNGHDQQPQNNLSEEYFNFQTQMPCESSNAWFSKNLVCSNGHEQQQNNLSEEHLNFQTGSVRGNQRPTIVTSMAELLAPSTSSSAAFSQTPDQITLEEAEAFLLGC